jgi:hypothetical protein
MQLFDNTISVSKKFDIAPIIFAKTPIKESVIANVLSLQGLAVDPLPLLN